jgi:hypothetical protein
VLRWVDRKGVAVTSGDWESTRYGDASGRIANVPDRQAFAGCEVDLVALTS